MPCSEERPASFGASEPRAPVTTLLRTQRYDTVRERVCIRERVGGAKRTLAVDLGRRRAVAEDVD